MFDPERYKVLSDKLEITELKLNKVLKNKLLRIDSDYYKKENLNNPLLKFENKLKNVLELEKVANIKTSKNRENFEYLEIANINLNLGTFETNTITTHDKIPDRATYILEKNDVCVSTVRPNRNAVAYIKNINKLLVGTSGFTVLRTKKIPSELLYIFCKTKYFIDYLIRENTATMYPAVTDNDILNVNFPNFSSSFQTHVAELVQTAHQKLEESKKLYSQAEEVLLEELAIDNSKLKIQNEELNISIKNFSESFGASGRLDAEYYQPKYEQYEQIIRNYKGGFGLLNEVCSLKDKNYCPKENQEYKYLELSNVGSTGEINGFTRELGQNLPSRARRIVKNGDVIISSVEGSIEKAALINQEFDKSLCSTGFYVINSEILNSETLLIIFKSSFMQEILRKSCSGTILTSLNKDDFLRILIPKIEHQTQAQIAELIQTSFRLRTESKELLERAKREVEEEIERG